MVKENVFVQVSHDTSVILNNDVSFLVFDSVCNKNNPRTINMKVFLQLASDLRPFIDEETAQRVNNSQGWGWDMASGLSVQCSFFYLQKFLYN